MRRTTTNLAGLLGLAAAALASGCGSALSGPSVRQQVDVRAMAPSPGADERGLVARSSSTLSRADRQAQVMRARQSGNLDAPGDAPPSLAVPSRSNRN